MGDVFIHRVALPPKVKGLIIKRNDDYIIFINEALSDAEQRKAILHELSHLENYHLEQDILSAPECENQITLHPGETLLL